MKISSKFRITQTRHQQSGAYSENSRHNQLATERLDDLPQSSLLYLIQSKTVWQRHHHFIYTWLVGVESRVIHVIFDKINIDWIDLIYECNWRPTPADRKYFPKSRYHHHPNVNLFTICLALECDCKEKGFNIQNSIINI